MKTRWLSAVLTLCMLLTLVPVTALAAEDDPYGEEPAEHPFTDVSADHWANDAVAYVYDNGLMSGVDGTTFDPDGTTTRAMLVTILYRLAGEPAADWANPFVDVPAGVWFHDAVTWAWENDVVNGTSSSAFSPDASLTREQMATILYRYADSQHYDTSAWASLSVYEDVGQISSYADDAMRWACGAGLLTGTSDTTLSPKGTATRAQIAVILSRFCQTMTPGTGGNLSQAQIVSNLENSSLPKKDTLVAMTRVLLEDGFEPAFVAGLLGNIIEEGACGIFESSAYVTRPDLEPDYLLYMDETYDYRNVYSGQYIYNGFSLSEVYGIILELGPGGANGRGSCFGLGCMQWTSYNRIKNLLENYMAAAGGADTITLLQVQQAESITISQELQGTYKKVYTAWQTENPVMNTMDAAFAAGVKVCTSYGIPVGYNTEAVQNTRGSNAAEVYAIMMGL